MRVGAAHAHCQPTSACAPPPHLRAVGKVSKLRLPDDQGVRVLNGVACRNRWERAAVATEFLQVACRNRGAQVKSVEHATPPAALVTTQSYRTVASSPQKKPLAKAGR